jgi:chromosome segregation ATPase
MLDNSGAIRKLRAENDALRGKLHEAAKIILKLKQDAEAAQAQALALRKEVKTAESFLGSLSKILGVTEKTLPAIERAAQRAATALRAKPR